MAIKFVFDGPKGRRINTRKRTRLILGFFGQYVPQLFSDFRKQALAKDPYLRIDFVRLEESTNGEIQAKGVL